MNTNNKITEPIDIPKRGRGRPKKGIEPVDDIVVTSESTRVNRGGRPRLSADEVEKRRLEKEAKPKGKRGKPKGDVPKEEYLRTARMKYYYKDPEYACSLRRKSYYKKVGKTDPRLVKESSVPENVN